MYALVRKISHSATGLSGTDKDDDDGGRTIPMAPHWHGPSVYLCAERLADGGRKELRKGRNAHVEERDASHGADQRPALIKQV